MPQATAQGNSQETSAPFEALQARKGKGRMDKSEFANFINGALSQSVQFVDQEMSYDRARATEYYLGKPFGNEEEGRSQVVMTEVRDAVVGILPSLMRLFFSSDHVVEFRPTRADCVDEAEQATDYVRYVFEEDNQGFLKTFEVLKDGLVRKIGIFKWGWDETSDTQVYCFEGVTDDELELLAADDDVSIDSVRDCPTPKLETFQYKQVLKTYNEQLKANPPQPGTPVPPPPQAPPKLNDVELTRIVKGGRLRVWALPPEEFVYNRQARTVDTALLCAHRMSKTRGELIAMGISEADIDEHAGAEGSNDISLKGNAEELARRDAAGMGRVVGGGFTNDPEMGVANDKILFCEAYVKLDYNGDGVAELRKVWALGPGFWPVPGHNTACSERPFAVFCPDPEPHTLVGGSWSDRTMDLQKINSALMRGIFDSLSASIFPRTVYLDGQAAVGDIMNTAIGAPIRERVAGAVRTLEVPFAGREALPILQFMQEVKERRIGQDNGAVGLDADALQSTTKEGVNAALSGSQQQAELVARIFAEMTLKPLFRGILRELIQHRPKARIVRLRGKYVEVDPRSWDMNMDVTVNVALGASFTEQKIQTLVGVLGQQKEFLMQLGPSNPLVTLGQLSTTLSRLLRLQGFPNTTEFFNSLPPNFTPPPQPPQPSPEELAMKSEQDMEQHKTLRELAIKRDELALKEKEIDLNHALEMRKMSIDAVLRRYQIDAQFHAKFSQAEMDNDLATETSEAKLALDMHSELLDRQAHEENTRMNDHQQTMDVRAADTADAAQAADPSGGANGAEE